MRVEEVVGRQVRERREALLLTQEQLGRQLGLYLPRPWSRQAVSAAEKGERSFGAAELVALAAVLRTTVGDLLRPPLQESEVELGGSAAIRKEALFDVIASKVPGDLDFAEIQRMLTRLAESVAHNYQDVGNTARLVQEVDRLVTQRVTGPQMTHADARAWRERLDPGDRALYEQIRSTVGAQEQQPVVAAIVTSGSGVLVGKRNDGKPPWTFIAGKIEAGESPADAAVREVKEEAALRVRAGEIIGQRVHPETGRTMVYMAAAPTHGTEAEAVVGDEAELAEVRWVTLAEADELLPGMFGPVREYLQREIGG